MTASVPKQDPNTKKASNERLFILTRTHSMHIFGEIPFIKPENDTSTTDKRLKTMKNEREQNRIFFWLSFCCFSNKQQKLNKNKVSLLRLNLSVSGSDLNLVQISIHFGRSLPA